MLDETSTRSVSPVHRAQIARLSLQLRALERDAARAEVAERGWDLDTALDQLRGRMSILIEKCRGDLAAELETERSRFSVRVAAARAAAATRLLAAAAERRTDEPIQPTAAAPSEELEEAPTPAPDDRADDPLGEMPEPVLLPIAPVRADADAAVTELTPEQPVTATADPEDDSLDDGVTETAAPVSAIEDAVLVALDRTMGPSLASGSTPIVVTLDAESFAKAFANALAGIAPQLGAAAGFRPDAPVFVSQAPAPKRSGWADAWHADVLLLALAMVIVLVILVAWST